MTYEEVLSHFQVKKYGNGKAQALCPAHPDKEASLTITQGNDGKTLLKCHAGCSSESVVLAAGLKMADLFSESTSQSMVICKGRRNQCKENRRCETCSRNHRGNQYLC